MLCFFSFIGQFENAFIDWFAWATNIKFNIFWPFAGGLEAFEQKLQLEEEEREAAKRREEERRAEISKKTRNRLSELLARKRDEVLQELERYEFRVQMQMNTCGSLIRKKYAQAWAWLRSSFLDGPVVPQWAWRWKIVQFLTKALSAIT